MTDTHDIDVTLEFTTPRRDEMIEQIKKRRQKDQIKMFESMLKESYEAGFIAGFDEGQLAKRARLKHDKEATDSPNGIVNSDIENL